MAPKELEEPLRSFLEAFEACNPIPFVDLKMDERTAGGLRGSKKLIYASFGTVHDGDTQPYLKIIDAIKELNARAEFGDICLIVSTGKRTFELFQQLIRREETEMPEYVLLMPRVPQLSVLKRASLFITHCGQNSTSESIHYGVPMVCIPVISDQPSVAYRVADELGLGIRLSYRDFTAEHVRQAIEDIFRDNGYLERSLLYAKISRKYKGTVNASKIVIEFLQSNCKKKIKTN